MFHVNSYLYGNLAGVFHFQTHPAAAWLNLNETWCSNSICTQLSRSSFGIHGSFAFTLRTSQPSQCKNCQCLSCSYLAVLILVTNQQISSIIGLTSLSRYVSNRSQPVTCLDCPAVRRRPVRYHCPIASSRFMNLQPWQPWLHFPGDVARADRAEIGLRSPGRAKIRFWVKRLSLSCSSNEDLPIYQCNYGFMWI